MTVAAVLKPLTTGQLLDRAFRLYRHNFLLFVGIVALPQIPLAIFNIAFSLWTTNLDPFIFSNPSPDNITEVVTIALYMILLGFSVLGMTALSIIISIAAFSQVVVEIYTGNHIGIMQAYRQIGRSWFTVLGVFFLLLLCLIICFIVIIIPCIGWLAAIPGIGFMAFFGLTIAPLSIPIIILEKKSASQALARAWALSRRRFWWIFGIALLVWLLNWAITIGPAILAQSLVLSLTDIVNLTVSTVLQQLVLFLIRILVLPVPLLAFILIYLDMRVRTEGLDLALTLTHETEEAGHLLTTIANLPTPWAKWNPTGTELGYFSLITVGWIALALALIGVVMLFVIVLGSMMGGF